MICSHRKVANVTTLFGKLSGGLGGGTIASVLGQLAESSKDQKGAAHPYSFNPPSDRSLPLLYACLSLMSSSILAKNRLSVSHLSYVACTVRWCKLVQLLQDHTAILVHRCIVC